MRARPGREGEYPIEIESMVIADIDLNDYGETDIYDIVLTALAFGYTPQDVNWDERADLNNDDVVDIFDIVLLATNFGKTA